MHRKNALSGYLFFLPGFLFFILFIIYPLFRNLYYSFFDLRLTDLNRMTFEGLANYTEVLTDRVFWVSIRNVIIYGLISVPGQMVLGFIAAYALHRSIPGSKLFRTLYFIPVITSWVIASLVLKFFFTDQGMFNSLLMMMSLIDKPISWLSEPGKAIAVLALLGIWKGIGWVMVIYLAALQGVPQELYEAASLDGCNGWQKIRYITLPSVRGNTLFIQLMLVIGAFNVFTSFYLITGGGPLHQTEVMLTWMYRKAFVEYDLGYASALSYLFAVIIGCLSMFQFRLNRQH